MEANTSINNNRLFVRLVSLWILSEAFLGGIIHGLKLPASGLLVGGAATICICLIAWHFPNRGTILKATMAVAIFKMMLSPHSPPAAYLAVFFQGVLGELLLRNRRFFSELCLIFGALTMAESALQRILILTLIYGTEFWEAVDKFVLKLTGGNLEHPFSLTLALGYVALHVLAGVFIGRVAWRLILRAVKPQNPAWLIEIPPALSFPTNFERASKPGIRLKAGLFAAWLFLIVLYIQATIQPETAWLPSHKAIHIVARSVLILLCWYLIFSPLLTRWLHAWLKKRQKASSLLMSELLAILPEVNFLVQKSWLISDTRKGFQRILLFTKILIVNILH